MDLFNSIISYFSPANFQISPAMKLAIYIGMLSLLIGLGIKIIFGKNSALNHCISSALSILLIYALAVVWYSYFPQSSQRYIQLLPFVSFNHNTLTLFQLEYHTYAEVCIETANLLLWAMLLNVLNTWIPTGKSLLTWFCSRLLGIVLAVHFYIQITILIQKYLPTSVLAHAPTIIIGFLTLIFLIGLLKNLLGVILTIANPIVGIIYKVFFTSPFGQILSKATVTTLIMTGILFILNRTGYNVIDISGPTLLTYSPLLIVILLMWYLLGLVL